MAGWFSIDIAHRGERSQWAFGRPRRRAGDAWRRQAKQGRLEIDGQEPAGRAGADVSGTTFGNWTVAWLNMSQGLRLDESTS